MGRSQASRPCQSCSSSGGVLALHGRPCLETLTWLGGCGEVRAGHSATVVTLALMDWPVEKSKALFSGKFSPS